VFDGPTNGRSFLAYVEQCLVPSSPQAMSSSWTIWDRTRARRCDGPSAAPAPSSSSYRPTVPISIPSSRFFAKLKILLRKAAERTIEATWKRIGLLLDRFTPAECAKLPRDRRIRFKVTRSRSRRSPLMWEAKVVV
jgi:hypothetical protein